MTPSRNLLGAGRDFSADDARRALALTLPVVMPLAMTAMFRVARHRLGDRRGYVVGFATYWLACAGLSVSLLGRTRIRQLFRNSQRGRLSGAVPIALLLWPPLGAVGTRLVPELRLATPTTVATSIGVAAANATLEELLWRGVYITLWPTNPWLGWLWPAIGFGAWHVAPQVIHASPMGRGVYGGAATALGLSWGWVAWRGRSLRWVSISHVITDGSGLTNARFFVGP